VDRSAGGSSISATRPSRASHRSAKASPASGSPGEAPLGPAALRAVAERHGVRPTKALGQHFLIDPNLARAIVVDAGLRSDDRVVEVGAGFGSLTVALAESAGTVVAVEFDRALLPALREVVGDRANVRIVAADATRLPWSSFLGEGGWVLVANLPYNISVPLVLGVLEDVPEIARADVMLQREVAERLVAVPGDAAYGPAALRVAFRGEAEIVRRVPPSVFWPRPSVGSAIVRLGRRPPPPVDATSFRRVVEVAFAERRKTIANALRRLGLEAREAAAALERSGIDPAARAERIGFPGFVAIARALDEAIDA
jgi:16S rRNA (adenine1518-N6/adenine1519-N6)-dimethyltransferase